MLITMNKKENINGGIRMSREQRILLRKLMSVVLCVAMVMGLIPSAIADAADSEEPALELVDYEDTYYIGFNDDVCIATGTTIMLGYGDCVRYVNLSKSYGKNEEVARIIDTGYLGTLTVSYQNNKVHVLWEKADDNGIVTTLADKDLYEPKYVSLDEMPTISLGEEKTIADVSDFSDAILCERYYRLKVDVGGYTAYTLAANDRADDTYLNLYDAGRNLLMKDDDSGEGLYSSMTFNMSSDDIRVVGIRSYSYTWDYVEDGVGGGLFSTKLKLVKGATAITSVSLDNAEDITILYKGINDDILLATGSHIKIEYDNGVCSDLTMWKSVKVSNTGTGYGIGNDMTGDDQRVQFLHFDKRQDGVYAVVKSYIERNNGILEDEKTIYEGKLVQPVIKELSEMPLITEGDNILKTPAAYKAFSYYRITAGNANEIWTLKLVADPDAQAHISIRDGHGNIIDSVRARWNGEMGTYGEVLVTLEIPAGDTRVIGIWDYDDIGVEYQLNAHRTVETIQDSKKDPEKDSKTETTQTPTLPSSSETTNAGTTLSNNNNVNPNNNTGDNGQVDKGVSEQVGSTFDKGGATYMVSKKSGKVAEVSYKVPKNKKKNSYSIPETIKLSDGTIAKVTDIAPNAFKNCKKIKKVTIGKNVTKIGKNAFSGCKNLKSIIIKGTKLKKNSFGKNAFKNINKIATFKVPKKQLKNYKKWIKKAGAPKTVKIKK